jgi:monoamine oxidase
MVPMDRRKFLKLTGAGAAALTFSCVQAHAFPFHRYFYRRAKTSPKNVLIIGAGVAGLIAARELKKAGVQVTILEGRDRAGGRILTNRDLGVPVELGPTWFHGGAGNPLKNIAKNLGIKTEVYNASNFAVADDSKSADEKIVYPLRDWPWVEKKIPKKIEQAVIWKLITRKNPSILDAFNFAEGKLSRIPNGQREIVFSLLKKYMDVDLAEPLDQASLHEMMVSSATQPEGDVIPVGEEFVMGGMDNLIRDFEKGQTILLNQIVKQIDHQQGSVTVTTATDVFKADAVIVTVAIGVLKNGDIQFTPELPDEHKNSIACLGMGTINKLVLEFPHGEWLPNAEFISVNSSFSDLGKTPCNFYVNYQYYGKKPILIGMIGGAYARHFESLSDVVVAEMAMADLRRGLGSNIPNPSSVHLTRWSQDPFSRGSYSGLPIGSSSRDRVNLAAPVNDSLYFAGEATDVHDYGTIHGAYFSGLRVAKLLT